MHIVLIQMFQRNLFKHEKIQINIYLNLLVIIKQGQDKIYRIVNSYGYSNNKKKGNYFLVTFLLFIAIYLSNYLFFHLPQFCFSVFLYFQYIASNQKNLLLWKYMRLVLMALKQHPNILIRNHFQP